MKKFEEILKDITMVKNEIKVLKEKQEVLTNQYLDVEDIKKRIETKKDLLPELNNISDEIINKNITIKILENNAKISLYNEVAPVIVETLEKFNNKPYGEKTKEKIKNIIKEKTNCSVYLNNNNYGGGSITIYHDHYSYADALTVGLVDASIPLLIDNKIQVPELNNLRLYYIKDLYIKNIPLHIDILKYKYEQAYKLQEELNEICKDFNNLAVGNIEYIHVDNKIYKTFRG